MTDKATKESKKSTEAIHDCARILELKIVSVAQMAWTKTETWVQEKLVLKDLTVYQCRRLLLYRNVNGVSTLATPYQSVLSEFTSLANRCFELNPTDMNRQDIIKTPAW